jgi:catechol 2,3-dioxygenase-like lactoylglutathione lyase family enzyme
MANLDHIGLTVSDFGAAKAFYSAALKPLGITVLMEFPGAAGLGADGKPFFWLSGGGKTTPHVHLAFAAASPSLTLGPRTRSRCSRVRG